MEVNLSFLSENFKRIQSLTPNSKVLPMVKADAYGHGLIAISRHLVNECGARKLGCASLGEALKLIEEVPDLGAEILVFSDNEMSDPDLRRLYGTHNITPVLHQWSDIEAVKNDPELKGLPVVIKVNTGMNRLGLSLEELDKALPFLKQRGVKHLLSHLACSYYLKKDGDKTGRQLQKFAEAKKLLADAGVEIEETSLSNSGAIEQGIGIEETYVRPGLMMYGPASVQPKRWDGHQISRLVTKVLKTFIVPRGTPVGYGIHVVIEDTLIALLPIGYGDGLLTYSSGVRLKVNGIEGKLFARVNMDMAFVAFPVSAAGKIQAGDWVEIWNHDNSQIADMATQMNTIPYQLMCAISGRIPRIYKVK